MAPLIQNNQSRQVRQQSNVVKTGRVQRLDGQSVGALSQANIDQPQYMDPKRAAEYLAGLSTSFLAKLRMEENRHRGPAFVKIGRVIFYRRSDLDRWVASRVVEVAQ